MPDSNGTRHIERLIEDLSASFQRETNRVLARMEQRFDELGVRFGDQAARLDRQGALIQSGSRWTHSF
jgi:RNA binding exosome subunit